MHGFQNDMIEYIIMITFTPTKDNKCDCYSNIDIIFGKFLLTILMVNLIMLLVSK